MDDVIAPRLQRMQNPRQCGDGSRLDIVQQQNASSLVIEPLHRNVVDPRGRNMPPVVCQKIRAPDLDALGGEVVLDAVGARQPGDPKERSKCSVIPERGLHRCYSVVDLLPGALDRHFLHVQGMILGVGTDAVAGVTELAHAFRIGLGHAADGEEGRLHALRGQNVENLIAVARQRPVIERQHHLVISERQRFGVLHCADPRMLPGIDHQGSRDAERVGMAGTIGSRDSLRGDAGE